MLAIFLYPKSPVAQYIYIGIEQLSQFIDDPLNNYKNSWGIRPLLMYHGVLVFMQSPLLGTGLGDYYTDLELLMNSGQLLVNDPIILTGTHNVFIHLLAETGVIGFTSFVLFVFALPAFVYSKYLVKYKHDSEICLYAISGLTVMVCHFTFGMVNTWLTNNSISIFLILNLVYVSNISILVEKKANK